jgi:hypothetical protein
MTAKWMSSVTGLAWAEFQGAASREKLRSPLIRPVDFLP